MTGELLKPPEPVGEVLSGQLVAAELDLSGYDVGFERRVDATATEMSGAFQAALAEPDDIDVWKEVQASREKFEAYRRRWVKLGQSQWSERTIEGYNVEAAWRFSYALSQCVEVIPEKPREAEYIWPDILELAEVLDRSTDGHPDTYDAIDDAGWGLHLDTALSYDNLMENAEHVSGMPFETPLRWQEAHNGFVGGGIACRYVMARKPNGGTLTLTRELQVEDIDHPMAWHYRDTTPTQDGSGYWWQTSVQFQPLSSGYGYSSEKVLYTPSPNASCRYLRQGGSREILLVNESLTDIAANGPDRQAEFLAGLQEAKE